MLQDSRAGRTLVEPHGYAITSFLSSAGLVGGFGLAPDGLLLMAAAILLSAIEWRRLRAANPWLRLETPEDFRTHEGKIILRYSAIGSGMIAVLAILAIVAVHAKGGVDASASGPALIAGVATLVLNLLLKRKLAAPLGPFERSDRMGDGRLTDRSKDDGFGTGVFSQDLDDVPGAGPEADPGEASRTATERRDDAEADAVRRDDALEAERRAYAADEITTPDPDDGFLDQDETALHGKRLEPRSTAKPRAKRGARRRDDR